MKPEYMLRLILIVIDLQESKINGGKAIRADAGRSACGVKKQVWRGVVKLPDIQRSGHKRLLWAG